MPGFVDVHRVSTLHIRNRLLVMHMQVGREEFVVVQGMKKVHCRILRLARGLAAAPGDWAEALR